MSIDVMILVIAWALTIIMLVLFTPKAKIREALVIFMFKQFMTWLLGLVVSQYRLIEYPVREFAYATKTSFSFEYFIYPAICVVFNLHYPEKKTPIRQFMYFAYFCTVMTGIEVLCEKYTNIINYIHWGWYATWISLFITFFISRKYYVWFFSKNKKAE